MIKTPHRLIFDEDLSKIQIYATIQTYDRFAKKYANKWEWNPSTIKHIKKYNIEPFLKYAQKNGKVLIVGCQTGRDYTLLKKEGFYCLGTEFSYGLLHEAVKRIPDGLFIRLFPQSLPFMPNSFDAVYADALTIVPKKDIKNTLQDFRIFLKTDGILYLSIKIGQANLMVMNDLGGERYFTLFKKDEILNVLSKIGFNVVWSKISQNTDSSLPKWFSLIAKKHN